MSHSQARVSIIRRQAVCATLGLLFAGSVPALGKLYYQWSLREEYAEQASALIAIQVSNFTVSKGLPVDVIGELASSYNVPVSFIEADKSSKVTIALHTGTVRQVLDQLVACDHQYCWRTIMGRLVVLPRTSLYDIPITSIHIVNKPRIEAASAYMGYLSEHVPGFEKLAGGIEIGGGSENTALVTLSSDATVGEHLMQTLGTDRSLSFCMARGADDLRFYSVGGVNALASHPSEFQKLKRWLLGTGASGG